MTAYNREKYIAEAIESVLAQTYTNWELIIVDDCSTDNTVAIAQSYAANDSRIKVYVNEKNLGDYHNRNRAAFYATGEFIKYLDADDMMYPHTISAMVNAMEYFPDAAYGFSYFGPQDDTIKYPLLYSPIEAYRKHFLGGGFFYAGPGGAIVRKKYFDDVKGFSGARYIGDTELWFKLAANYNSVLFWPTLIWWRSHEDQESKYESKDYQAQVERYKLVKKVLNEKNPLSKDEIAIADKNFTRIYCRNILRYFFKGNFKGANYLKKHGKVSLIEVLLSVIPVNKLKKIM